VGWSELAATNAPVADEPVEAVFRMNENPISLPGFFFFFHLSPSPELLAPETLSGSELGAWSRLGAGASLELGRAWSLELGAARAGPKKDPSKHFLKITMFIFLPR
jgi:hypothetical protein